MAQDHGTPGSAPTDAAVRPSGTGLAGLLVFLTGLAGIYPGIQLIRKGGDILGGESAYTLGVGAATLFLAFLSLFAALLVYNQRPIGRTLGIVVAVGAIIIGVLLTVVHSPDDPTYFGETPIVAPIWSVALLILGAAALIALLASRRHFHKPQGAS